MTLLRFQHARAGILILIAVGIVVFFAFDLQRLVTLTELQREMSTLKDFRADQPMLSAALFFFAYVAVAALSLPGAAVMSLAAGAIFGLGWGTVLVSFASSCGATIACALSRYLFHDFIRSRSGDSISRMLDNVEGDCAYYLFSLRLVPLFPFSIINLVMGLTNLHLWTFYWVSQVGMLAGTVVYVNAGTQVSRIDSLEQIFSPAVLLSLVLLAVLPFGARRALDLLKRRRLYAPWRRPKRFDRNLVVIGGGSAGLVTAYIAAAMKAKVTLVEKHKMGGDCLNTGCVPSKALIRSGRFLAQVRKAREFGIQSATADFEFSDVMKRVQTVIGAVEPHDSVARYTGLGVEVIEGYGKFLSPWEMEIIRNDGRTQKLTSRSFVIAAGARPLVPDIEGIDEVEYLTTDTIWGLRTCPRRLLVLGGGPIGCELAQAFSRLGATVTLVEMAGQLLIREDPEVAELVMQRFHSEGIIVLVNHEARQFNREAGRDGTQKWLVARHNGADVRIPFDSVLIALGRRANLDGYGLDGIGIVHGQTIETNALMQTNYPNIYAAGDVTGPYQFTHAAAHQAWYAAVNALLSPIKTFPVDYSALPWATFVEPEVARVGLNESDAKQQGIVHEVTKYLISDLDRAIADGAREGFVKVITPPGSDRILGVTIVGEHAAELLAEFVLAMRHGLGLGKILGTIHVYPTLAEANKFAAGEWRKRHLPHRLLQWAGRFHDWRRG